ncbi:MAG TPA: DUF3052 domain-containing protein [Terriglobales bacterium]|nr:MAG: DUF3052 domain-containing protein [Acidobacteriota bacterium]HEV2730139.1 DUF3052 domain-containing protein [Terriglobales bacterium]
MAGYSGTPLAKKLGIKPNYRVAFADIPAEVEAELQDALSACDLAKDGRFDFIMIFTKQRAELKRQFSRLAKQLTPAGMLWISWPKKISGVATDLDENEVRRIGLDAGLVDIKVCAVNNVWSGLKFVIPVKDRAKKGR